MEMKEAGQLTACRRAVREDVRRLWQQQSRLSQRQLARDLGTPASTLRRWCTAPVSTALPGRPRLPLDPGQLDAVHQHVRKVAGRTTVAALKASFPAIARAVLEHILSAFKRVLRLGRRRHLARLTWARPGTVWAADFTLLDGRGSACALSVRDLASGKALYLGTVQCSTAEVVVALLAELFEQHGPPLILKMDNGSGFVAELTEQLLKEYGVLALYSPPGTPAYNGACEAGIGSAKRAAADIAWLEGHDGPPDEQHLSEAAAVLNAMPRGRAAASACPDSLWARRESITPALRCQLRARHRRHESVGRAAAGIAKHEELSHAEQASLDRHAIRDALCDLNLLQSGGDDFRCRLPRLGAPQ